MGLVWRARDLELQREVALKEVRPPDPMLPEGSAKGATVLRERVLREARALARLQHPRVVTIFHIVTGRNGEYPWLVMELVPGGSLADRLDSGPMSPAQTARLGRDLLSGLRAAHSAGILHRDVKPANVLIREDGSPVLTDFGIAALGELNTLTTTGALIGSPEYMAPERLRGQEGNPSSDLWSLGMLLYVAVEGAHPMRRDTVWATLAAILEAPVPAPTRAGPLASVLTALLSHDPETRPDSAGLDQLLATAEAQAATDPEGTTGVAAPPSGPGTTVESREPEASAEAPTLARSDSPPRESDQEPHTPGPAPSAPGYHDVATRPRPAPDAKPATDVSTGTGGAPEPADSDEREAARPSDAAPERVASGSSRRTGFRRAKGLVKIALVLVLIGAGVRYLPGLVTDLKDRGSSAVDDLGKPQADEEHLFTPEGVHEAIAALKPLIGSTTVSSMSSHGSHLTVSAPRKDDPKVQHWYQYRDGKATDDGPAGVTTQPPALDLSKFDWNLLPGLWREAQNDLGIKNAERSHMILHNDADTGLELTLWVRDEYGNARMIADRKGEVIERTPRETASADS